MSTPSEGNEISGTAAALAHACRIRERSGPESLQVQQAFVLGWHVAQLFHSSVPRDPVQAEERGPRLIGLSRLNPGSRYHLQVRMVEADIHVLKSKAENDLDIPSTQAIEQALSEDGHQREAVLDAIYQLHVELLETLTVADFRLGKAYGLGRALAETAAIPALAPDPDRTKAALTELLGKGRVYELSRWLSALKSELPDHAAYATYRTLEEWRDLKAAALQTDLSNTIEALTAQGRVWRALLSGEKAAVDLLNEGDYVKAAEALIVRSGCMLGAFFRRFWWAIVPTLAVVAGVVCWIGGSSLTSGGKVAAAIATIAAGLGLSVKSASSALTRAAAQLEGPLWASELDESIAIAAARLPRAAPTLKRRHGDQVGELRPSYTPPDDPPEPDAPDATTPDT